ncbi:MAG: hypothetical protein ABWY05_05255 [Noviherbaspirillum sp.]
MEHLDAGTAENWYANREMPLPASLRRLAVIAPDDAPGLAALRQRLAQRPLQALECNHFAAGFKAAGKASLAGAFEQIRQQHAIQPYDIVLLLEGRPDALGIAESNGLIPEQVSRMPVPVWTAIGEDDANTELGDVANRVFSSPAALIAALPLPSLAKAQDAPPAPATAPALGLVTPAGAPSLALLPASAPPAAKTPVYASAHPLVLCAAGAVIIACLTAIAAMLGWLPTPHLATAADPGRRAPVVTSVPATPPPATVLRAPETPAAAVPEPVPEPAAAPAPQDNSAAGSAALAAAAAAGVIGSAPRNQAANPPVKRPRQAQRRRSQEPRDYAQEPRQVGSNEVPVVEFVGTKTREQVIAEMMAARRASNRQAGNSSVFPGFENAAPRR